MTCMLRQKEPYDYYCEDIVRKNTNDETALWNTVEKVAALIPDKDVEVYGELKWGYITQLFTPAFWKLQYELFDCSTAHSYRLGSSLIEEVVMCILGGYGIPSEMGEKAFHEMKLRGLIQPSVSHEEILKCLSAPFESYDGRSIRYRFFNQKSRYVYQFLNRKDLNAIPIECDKELREWLLSNPGIGLKTASWITRNWLKSESVAILDVHLLRAGKLTGFFETNVLSNYYLQEQQYLNFCRAIDVFPSKMDAVIWKYMKTNSRLAIKSLFSFSQI